MVFTDEEEQLIRLGIELYKKRVQLESMRKERRSYNLTEINSLETDIKNSEAIIKTEIGKSA